MLSRKPDQISDVIYFFSLLKTSSDVAQFTKYRWFINLINLKKQRISDAGIENNYFLTTLKRVTCDYSKKTEQQRDCMWHRHYTFKSKQCSYLSLDQTSLLWIWRFIVIFWFRLAVAVYWAGKTRNSAITTLKWKQRLWHRLA